APTVGVVGRSAMIAPRIAIVAAAVLTVLAERIPGAGEAIEIIGKITIIVMNAAKPLMRIGILNLCPNAIKQGDAFLARDGFTGGSPLDCKQNEDVEGAITCDDIARITQARCFIREGHPTAIVIAKCRIDAARGREVRFQKNQTKSDSQGVGVA